MGTVESAAFPQVTKLQTHKSANDIIRHMWGMGRPNK